MISIAEIDHKVRALKRRYAKRDVRNSEVSAVLNGEFDAVAPGLFSDEWPQSIVANRIEVLTMHAAAALAPLPGIMCSTPNATQDSARKFASKRTSIANSYIENSFVQRQMQRKAAGFYTYGLLVTSVEPNFETSAPQIVVESPMSVYPVWDKLGRTVACARIFERSLIELSYEYPEIVPQLTRKYGVNGMLPDQKSLQIIKFSDKNQITMYVADAPDIVLLDIENTTGKCLVVATPRPGASEDITGAFDQLIWIQLALHAMQTYTMSGVAQSVNAPIVVPGDVVDVEIGPGSIIKTNMGKQSVGRVDLDVPQGAWAANGYLASELEFGAIVPEAMSGKIDASVVTGKGVQQLMAGYSQQIALAQESLVDHWRTVVGLALCVDQHYWPDETKDIQGKVNNAPYSLSYKPSRDINGDYTVDVQYGGVAGLDANRSLVFLLQELGADIVSKGYIRRHIAGDINPEEEESRIAVEQMRDSLMQGMSAFVQSIPLAYQAGQDPADIIARAVQVTTELQKGRPLEQIMAEVFPPPQPEPEPQQAPPPADAGLEPEGAPPDAGGLSPAGMPPGLRPGLATRGPGARPDMNMLYSGVSASGAPNIQAGVSRFIPQR